MEIEMNEQEFEMMVWDWVADDKEERDEMIYENVRCENGKWMADAKFPNDTNNYTLLAENGNIYLIY